MGLLRRLPPLTLAKRITKKSLRGHDLAAERLLSGGVARAAHLGVGMAEMVLVMQ